MQVIPRNIPEDCDPYLTEGKVYDVADLEYGDDGRLEAGWIKDNEGVPCFILLGHLHDQCLFLSSCSSNKQGYWEIVSE